MAESEVDRIMNKIFWTVGIWTVVHAMVVGLIMSVIVIVICLLASSVAKPAENNNVQMQTAPRTFDDNVHAVLKKQGYVE